MEVLEQWVTDLEAEVERLQATLEVMCRFCARVQEGDAEEPMERKPTAEHSRKTGKASFAICQI